MQHEFEKYKKQLQIAPEILEQKLEEKVRREEELILGKPLEERRKLIISLRSKKKNIFRKEYKRGIVTILPFDIFPKGSITISKFIGMLRYSGMNMSYEDEMRIYKIVEKFPNYQSICVGKGNFNGFVVFRFDDTDVVIVEKPSYGNATYLIKGDWEKDIIKILQLSRGEAREQYSKQVKRVTKITQRL